MKIVTPRLELVAATLKIVTADLHQRHELPVLLDAQIGAGWPPPLVDVEAMQRVKEALLNETTPSGWGSWYVLLKHPRILIAFIGFKSKPASGVVELGYSVLENFQRRGFATGMVGALSAWAFEHEEVHRVRAETLPELIASQRVLLKNGFALVGGAEPGVLRFELKRNVTHRWRYPNQDGSFNENLECGDSSPLFGLATRRQTAARQVAPRTSADKSAHSKQLAGGSDAASLPSV